LQHSPPTHRSMIAKQSSSYARSKRRGSRSNGGHDDTDIIKILARHGVRVQGRLTNAAMHVFLQEQKKRDCKFRIGKKRRQDLIAKIRALDQHTPTVEEPREDNEHGEEEEVVEEGTHDDQLERERERERRKMGLTAGLVKKRKKRVRTRRRNMTTRKRKRATTTQHLPGGVPCHP